MAPQKTLGMIPTQNGLNTRLFGRGCRLIREGSLSEFIYSMLVEFPNNVRLHGNIEFFFQRSLVGSCSHYQAFQQSRMQYVMFVATSQGHSPLLRTPAYEYRNYSSSVKRQLSEPFSPVGAMKSRLQQGFALCCNMAYTRAIRL